MPGISEDAGHVLIDPQGCSGTHILKEYIDVNGATINHNGGLWYIPIDIDTMDKPAHKTIALVGRCPQGDGLAAEIGDQAANRTGGKGWMLLPSYAHVPRQIYADIFNFAALATGIA